MQLQDITTPPPNEPPAVRYARLHRAAERGLASDELWKELAEVCVTLGHTDEAIRVLRRMSDGALRSRLEVQLARMGVIAAKEITQASTVDHGQAAFIAQRHGHPAAAATDEVEPPPPPSVTEHLLDALQYLCHQHMPWVALVGTLAFPLMIGIGGFLTGGGSPLLLAALAALPGLCVLVVVAALSRRILVDSADGSSDAPAVAEPVQLLRDARRFAADTLLVAGALLGPSLLTLQLGVSWVAVLPGLLPGAVLLPLAWALRQVRSDFGALSPTVLLQAILRCGGRYFAIVGLFWALFAPALALAFATRSYAMWIQIAAVGPLLVLPLLMASRLVGTFLDAMRIPLGCLLLPASGSVGTVAAQEVAVTPAVATMRQTPHEAPQQLAQRVERPLGQQPGQPAKQPLAGAASVKPAAAARAPVQAAGQAQRQAPKPGQSQTERRPAAAQQRRQAPPAQTTAPRPQPARIEGRAPVRAPAPTAKPEARPAARQAAPAPVAATTHAPARQTAAARPVTAVSARVAPKPSPGPAAAPRTAPAVPGLANIPGATVVTGAERAKAGAAARRR